MLKTLYNDFYGDETRWWVGVVQSIDDPEKQGRVRVRIYGVHSASEDDIPNSALPWAQVVAPITHGGTSGINGTAVGIQPYAQAFGIFLDGKHSQLPLVLGSIPKIDGKNASVAGGRGGDPGNFSDGAGGGGGAQQSADFFDPRGEAGRTNPGVRGGGNTSRTGRLRGGTPVEQIYNYLESYFRTELNLGNSKELAAGFAGNFDAESIGGQFDIENGLGFRGIAQWDKKDRGPKMNRFATQRGGQLYPTRKYPGGGRGNGMVPDLAMQLDWVIHELTTVKWLKFDKIAAEGTTPERAADRVEAYYEISEFSTAYGGKMPDGRIYKYGTYEQRQARGKPKLGAYQKRLNFAREIYNQFAINKRSSAE